MKVTLIVTSLLFLACSSQGEDGSGCHIREGKDGAFLWCDDGTDVILTNGKDGKDGVNGEKGKDGKNGTAGLDGTNGKNGSPGSSGVVEATRIIESFFCATSLENTLLGYSYNAILLNSGDLFVTGTVHSQASSSSGTAFFTPTQNGYKDASVSMVFDQDGLANGGWFKLSLDRSTLTSVVEYRAADPGPVTQTWTLSSSVCAHNKY